MHVNKLFKKAAAKGGISTKEAKNIAKAIKKGGVSKNEKAALKQAINVNADAFVSAAAKKPLTALLGSASTSNPSGGGQATGSSQSASTAGGSGGGGGSSIVNSIGNSIPNGYGLTPAQEKLLEGQDQTTQEYKSAKLQLMMGNYKNNMEMVSNLGKMLTELSSSIIRNIRS